MRALSTFRRRSDRFPLAVSLSLAALTSAAAFSCRAAPGRPEASPATGAAPAPTAAEAVPVPAAAEALPSDSPQFEAPVSAARAAGLTVSWEKDMLTIHGPGIPGGKVEVWYLEAYCRSGSTGREWAQTVIPHRTEKLEASPDGKRLKLRCEVKAGGEDHPSEVVEVIHEIRAGVDDVDFRVTATNHGSARADVVWAQPCMRVGAFTGREQEDYVERCFIFIDETLTTLDRTRRESEALYKGGQVYVPHGIDRRDVNPRPLSPDEPSNSLVGCTSQDGRRILAMAWEPCQELFQGVIVCIHSDFRLGGLEPGEVKAAHGKIYIADNDPEKLLERYRNDFPD